MTDTLTEATIDPEVAPESDLTAMITKLVTWNTARIRRAEPDAPNPRPIEDQAWCVNLVAAHPAIQAEWDAFAGAGGRLPRLDDLFGSWQGNVGGWWKAGGLISRRKQDGPLAPQFPNTVAALMEVPDLLSASFSVFGPGAELPIHNGMNAGAFNLLVGVHYPAGAGHEIEGAPLRLDHGRVVIFDDTLPHAAWNRSDVPRVMLHGDVLRRLPGLDGAINRGVQWASHWLTPSYRRAARNGAELHRALNG